MDRPIALPDLGAVQEAVRRYALARCRRSDLAEDIAQETCLKLVEYSRRETIRHPYALAFRIAESQLADEGRRRRRLDDESALAAAECRDPRPDAVTDARAMVRRFQSALDAMPPMRREVFLRRRLHGEGHTAIASAMGISLAAVEKHITRAMLDLRAVASDLTEGAA